MVMAHGPNYRVKFRRRREGKTNYYKRYVYVISKVTRLVVRITNKHIIAQVIKAESKGDVTLVAAHSFELVKKYGWKGYTANTPAAYLVGYLVGLRALKAGIKEVVLDIGLHTPDKGSRVFVVAKGAIDAGLKVPLGEMKFDMNRIKGAHIAQYATKLENENLDKFKRIFSAYLSKGFNPKDLPGHFDEILNKIRAQEGVSKA